ncbi:GntR family transcriptional regulator [Streptomyces sp. NPDC005356]|uniref:GntR family transcriptional regulator n=1 Tax=Streptomyces sp. NPDC005356 TaxID=3157167 RepID=UPI0033BCC508
MDMASNIGRSTGLNAELPDGKAALLYERLKSDVVSGQLAPGQRLSEASLSREYGISRSPVREATIRLEHDGLIERQGMILRVRRRSAEEIIDIYRARVYLESAIAADAAARRTDRDARRLQAAVQAESQVDIEDPAAVVAANRVFHDALAVAAHNDTLKSLQDRLTGQIAAMPATTLSHPGRWEQAHGEHQRIVRAVEERDSASARAIAEEHMSRARDIRLHLFNQQLTD